MKTAEKHKQDSLQHCRSVRWLPRKVGLKPRYIFLLLVVCNCHTAQKCTNSCSDNMVALHNLQGTISMLGCFGCGDCGVYWRHCPKLLGHLWTPDLMARVYIKANADKMCVSASYQPILGHTIRWKKVWKIDENIKQMISHKTTYNVFFLMMDKP